MVSSIWQSRKFWITVVDVVVSLTTYFVGKYLNPAAGQDIMTLVLALQPVVLLLIGSYTVQNVAGIKASGIVEEAEIYNAGRTAVANIEQGESEPE